MYIDVQAVRDYKCMWCGADKGQPCKTKSTPKVPTHSPRLEQAVIHNQYLNKHR